MVETRTVATKEAVGSSVAKLIHPEDVRNRLRQATLDALDTLGDARPLEVGGPATVRMRFASTTRADILQAVPGMRRLDGTSVEYRAGNMVEAYKLIRLMYKYISW